MDEEDKLLAKAERQAVAGMTPDAGWGAALASLLKRKSVCELPLTLSGEPTMVRDRAVQVVYDHGWLVDNETGADGIYRVRGIVRCKWKSRTLVAVRLTPSGSGRNEVLVRAVSREALSVRLHNAEKATRLIAEALPQTIPEYGTWPS